MKLRNSEVFDNYVRISREQGFVSSEALQKKADIEGKAPNPNRRGEDLSTIEIMYGVKPNGKDEDILDQAHPEKCIIAPSYDKLNGLVENLRERQDIMVGIINKAPQAKLTGHKYAGTELQNELISLGFFLDNQGDERLCALADSCSERLDEELRKEADFSWSRGLAGGGPLALGLAVAGPAGWAIGLGVAAGAYILTGIYNHLPAINQGIRNNCEKTLKELNDMLKDEKYNNIRDNVTEMISVIGYVKTIGDKTSSLGASMPKASLSVASNAAMDHQNNNSDDLKQIDKLLSDFQVGCDNLAKVIPGYIDLIQKVEGTFDEGANSELFEMFKWIGRKVHTTEGYDAIKYMKTLYESLLEANKEIESKKKLLTSQAELGKEHIIEDIKKRISEKDAKGYEAPSLPSEPKSPLSVKSPAESNPLTNGKPETFKDDFDQLQETLLGQPKPAAL